MTQPRTADEPMLLERRSGALLRMVLNRPERRNALHPEQLRALASLLADASHDDTVSAVSIEGAGSAAFSAGFDIKVLAEGAVHDAPPSASLFETIDVLQACRKPAIALVRGYCLGAGFDLAMACDFRIGTEDARFGVPAARLGTVYEPRSVDRVQRLLGPVVAKELFVMGREIDAHRALAVGILQDLVPSGKLDDALARWVGERSEAAEAHKQMIDALAAPAERPPTFWEPLDLLRSRSVDSPERARALRAFNERGAVAPTTETVDR